MVSGKATPEEAEQFFKLLALISVLVSCIFFWRYSQMIWDGKARFSHDFEVFYRAAQFWNGGPLYLNALFAQMDRVGTLGEVNYHPYLNPPFLAFFLWPFSLMSYEVARIVYLCAQLVLWVCVLNAKSVRSLWPELSHMPLYLFLALALSSSFVTNCVLTGQMGIFYASVMLLGVANLERKPMLAAPLLACMAFKPTLALLIPVYLLAARQYRTLIVCGIWVLVPTILSFMLWKQGIWLEWLEAMRFHSAIFMQESLPDKFSYQLISLYANLRLVGFSAEPAYIIQGIFSIVCTVLLWVIARRYPFRPETFGFLFICIFSTSAYVLQYDVVLMAGILLLMLSSAFRNPMRQGVRIAMIMAVFSGMITIQLQMKHLPCGAFSLLFVWYYAFCGAFFTENDKKPLNINRIGSKSGS